MTDQVQLSSSNGTMLVVEGIKQAKELTKKARVRLSEINDGKYKLSWRWVNGAWLSSPIDEKCILAVEDR